MSQTPAQPTCVLQTPPTALSILHIPEDTGLREAAQGTPLRVGDPLTITHCDRETSVPAETWHPTLENQRGGKGSAGAKPQRYAHGVPRWGAF